MALILATESAVLLFSGQMTRNRVMLVGAYLSAAFSIFWGMDGMLEHETHGLWLAIGLGLLMTVNSLVAHYYLAAKQQPSVGTLQLRPQPAYFFVLALAIWLVATWNNTAHANFPVFLAIEAVLLVSTVYLTRIPEITLLSFGYLGLAQIIWA
ncbi:MAG TPA: hypothetical protein VFA77_06175, partial [Candidatus Eisenbacteria bacterium]|nr:hypothetical protein [Candidatus Eisenbacteria bacterium]